MLRSGRRGGQPLIAALAFATIALIAASGGCGGSQSSSGFGSAPVAGEDGAMPALGSGGSSSGFGGGIGDATLGGGDVGAAAPTCSSGSTEWKCAVDKMCIRDSH